MLILFPPNLDSLARDCDVRTTLRVVPLPRLLTQYHDRFGKRMMEKSEVCCGWDY